MSAHLLAEVADAGKHGIKRIQQLAAMQQHSRQLVPARQQQQQQQQQ